MRLDGRTIVRANIDVNAKDPAIGFGGIERNARFDGLGHVQQCQHGRTEDE